MGTKAFFPKSNFLCPAKVWCHTLSTAISAAIFLTVLSVAFFGFSNPAKAQWNNCSGITSSLGQSIILNLVTESCSVISSSAALPSSDFILFDNKGGASVEIFNEGTQPPGGSFTALTVMHDGGTFVASTPTQLNLFDSQADIGAITCASGCTVSGSYSSAPISGAFSVTYTQTGGSGSVGDTAPPMVSVVTAVTTPTNDSTPDFVFSSDEAGTLAVGGSCGTSSSTSVASGNNTITLTQTDNSTPLADGTFTNCTVTVTDGVGNPSSALAIPSFTIDTTAPVISAVTPVTTPTGDSTPDYVFTTNETGTLAVGGSCGTSTSTTISSTGNQTITLTQTDNSTALTDGTYTDCTVTVTDDAGNASPALGIANFTVDTTGPVISTVTAVPTPDNDSTPNYTFTTNETGTLAVGGSCGTSTSTTISSTGNQTITLTQTDNSTPLADGTFTNCTVTVTDGIGNASSALAIPSFTIDTTAPVISAVTPVTTPTGDSTPDYVFTTNETGTLAVGGSCGTSTSTTISSTGNQTITLTQTDNSTALTDGTYTDCTVTVTDDAGNASPALGIANFTVDTTGPVISTVTAVPTPDNDSTPNYTFTTNETGTLAVGGSCGTSTSTTISSTGNQTITLTQTDNSTPLADGTFTNCTVTVTDGIGNASSALAIPSFTIDTTAPVISAVTPVTTPTGDSTPDYVFTTNETGTLAVGGSCGTSTSTTISSTGNQTITLTQTDNSTALTDGTYTDCTVTVTDGAGNASPALGIANFTVDTVAPNAPSGIDLQAASDSGTSDTDDITNDTTPTYSVTWDAGTTLSASSSIDGSLTLSVTAGTGASQSVTITGGLTSNGTHTITWTATDGASNTASDTSSITVDTMAPNAPTGLDLVASSDTGTSNSDKLTNDTTPELTVTAESGSTITFTGTTNGVLAPTATGTGSSQNVTITTVLSEGSQNITATATDVAGNTSSASTALGIQIDTTAPSGFTVSIDQDPITGANNTAVSFTFGSAETSTSHSFSFSSSGGGTPVAGGGSVTSASQQVTGLDLSGLGSGTGTLSVTLTDAAGNTSNPAVTDTAVIDTSTPVFSAAYSPTTIVGGGTSTLTFTIDNSGGSAAASSLSFAVSLPTGVTVASTPNTSSTCTTPGTVSAAGGGTGMTYSGGAINSGATCTVSVDVTASAAGSYPTTSGALTSDLGNSGTAAATLTVTLPEIEVSSSASGALINGGTDTQTSPAAGIATTVTYTVTNTGSSALTIATATSPGAATNVTVNSISAPGTTTVTAGGGTTTFTVQYTPTSTGAFSFNLSFTNDDADENPYNFTVSGNAAVGVPAGLAIVSGDGQTAQPNAAFAAPLVALVTDAGSNPVPGTSVTFTAPASGASLTFASTGTNTETVTTDGAGLATSSTITANATSSTLAGTTLTSYSVVASATGVTSVSFSLTNGRDSAEDIRKTKDAIAGFVSNRANSIVGEQPDIVDRLKGQFGQQQGANGFAFNATPGIFAVDFAFSARAFANRLGGGNGTQGGQALTQGAGARYEVFDHFRTDTLLGYSEQTLPGEAASAIAEAYPAQPGDSANGTEPRSGFDFWLQGSYARSENKGDESETGIFFAGVDYRHKDRFVVGLMGQLDITDQENATNGTESDGIGWMAGPYGVARVHQNLFLDARASYGWSDNNINALGAFTDDFQTERFLAQAGVTGDFEHGPFTANPFAKLTYYREEQKAYTDSLGNRIGAQTFDLGRLEFGPSVTYAMPGYYPFDLDLTFTLSGLYDFDQLETEVTSSGDLRSADQRFRARAETGGKVVLPGRGIAIQGKSFYDGIGANNYSAYGGSLAVTIPF